jgi:hypothetical protein
MCTLIVGSDRSEPFSLEISCGDKLGIFYVNETNAVGLTHNGTAKGKLKDVICLQVYHSNLFYISYGIS